MHQVLRKWYERYFADEEAIILLVILATCLAVVLLLGQILAPVLASLVFAYLLQGCVAVLARWRFPHVLAVSLVTLGFVGVFMAALLVVLPLVSEQLALFWHELPRLLAKGQQALDRLASSYGSLLPEQTVRQALDDLRTELTRLGPKLLSFSALRSAFGVMLYLILVPILVFFLLLDRAPILRWLAGLLPERRPLLSRIWHEMDQQMANYVRGKAIEILVVGSVSFIAFVWLDLRYAALLAVLVGLSVIIPYIGATVVTLPVLVVGFMQWGWSGDFFWLAVIYGLIQALDGNVLVPLLFSEAVNLHPVVIITAVLLFGGIWGFWGVFFAIPLATLAKAVFNAWPRHADPAPCVSEAMADAQE